MPEFTEDQIADLHMLRDVALRSEQTLLSLGPSLTKCISLLKGGIPGTSTLRWH